MLLHLLHLKKYIESDNVGHILDNIQQCYDNPDIVCAALDAIISCRSMHVRALG